MGKKFNVDKFCERMQKKVKALKTNVRKEFPKVPLNKIVIEITINDKKIIHYLPCDIPHCRICPKIDRLNKQMGGMTKRMEDLFKGFDEFWDGLK